MIFVAFNTFFALPTQDDQVRCFRNVADHLTDDGIFVVEAFVPDPGRFDRGQRVEAAKVEMDRVILEASTHDPVGQRTQALHVVITEDGPSLYPVQIRYAWPAELDLMARLAGLRLRSRWGGFREEAFTAESSRHVSVYARV
jgi:hypothetical protein